jgi:hypothetical protein
VQEEDFLLKMNVGMNLAFLCAVLRQDISSLNGTLTCLPVREIRGSLKPQSKVIVVAFFKNSGVAHCFLL